jgi:hypothetical protein
VNKFFIILICILFIISSGILFIFIGQIDNPDHRYKIIETFQISSSKLFDLTETKLKTQKLNTIIISNYHLAPLVNLSSSIFWTLPFVLLFKLIRKKTITVKESKTNFWKQYFITYAILSVFLFIIWLFLDVNFIYDGVYGPYKSSLKPIYEIFMLVLMFLPSIVPSYLSSIYLEHGGDTLHGYQDLIVLSKTMTTFSVLIWSLIIVCVNNIIKYLRSKYEKKPSS